MFASPCAYSHNRSRHLVIECILRHILRDNRQYKLWSFQCMHASALCCWFDTAVACDAQQLFEVNLPQD